MCASTSIYVYVHVHVHVYVYGMYVGESTRVGFMGGRRVVIGGIILRKVYSL